MKSKIPGFEVGDITIMPMDGPTAQEVQQIFQMNQNAITCSKAGDHIAAEKWHRKALSAKYAAKLGNDTIGISENGLGETLYDLGKYDEAEEHLKKALAIRQKLGSRYLFDIAVTRENLAQVYQAKKDVKMARETRQQGEAKGELCCSNYTCPLQNLKDTKLFQCGGCKLPRYCSKSCQTTDWKKRHKAECKALRELQQLS